MDIEEDLDLIPMIVTEEEDIEIAVIAVIETETKVVKKTKNIQKTKKIKKAAKNIKNKDADHLLDQTHDQYIIIQILIKNKS